MDFSLKPVTDSSGRVIQLIPEGRDITEHKLAEQDHLLHVDRLANMDRINRAIQGAGDFETMMRDVLDEMLDILDCDRSYLTYPCDPTAKYITIPMERTRPEYPGLATVNTELPMDERIAATHKILLSTPGAVQFGPTMAAQASRKPSPRTTPISLTTSSTAASCSAWVTRFASLLSVARVTSTTQGICRRCARSTMQFS
jgi:hypothetical protein